MTASALFWIGIGSLIAAAIANFAHRALSDFSRHELEETCRRRGRPERFGEILEQYEAVDLGVEIIAALLTALGIVASLAWGRVRWGFAPNDSPGVLLGAAGITGLLLASVRTWLPWAAARLFGESFLEFTWPLWRSLVVLVMPLSFFGRVVDATLHRAVGRTRPEVDEGEAVEDELRTIVTEGHRGGLLEEDAREMIEGVIDLADAAVSQIMTPRTDMHMVHVDEPWDAIVADVIQSGHTRVPVYDQSRDDIIGLLYSKDLLPELTTANGAARTPIRELVRKPMFVPESKPLDDLLEMFQQMRTHIAIVLDEYGGVSGLVTIEDVLEEIVGEIEDEYDPETVSDIEWIDEDTCEALGKAHVDEINSTMSLKLPEDGDFDTIGGFVFSEMGRVPSPGESLVWQDRVRISVLEASRRRIDRVRIERLDDDRRESA
ncbi:MAG: HlyC/CorC family transporter [Planctomycetales bacterium]|nr:HlyC/CorC family transporter [Planctomycetales bacterium]